MIKESDKVYAVCYWNDSFMFYLLLLILSFEFSLKIAVVMYVALCTLLIVYNHLLISLTITNQLNQPTLFIFTRSNHEIFS